MSQVCEGYDSGIETELGYVSLKPWDVVRVMSPQAEMAATFRGRAWAPVRGRPAGCRRLRREGRLSAG